jgi:hypothetical protein
VRAQIAATVARAAAIIERDGQDRVTKQARDYGVTAFVDCGQCSVFDFGRAPLQPPADIIMQTLL